MLCMVISFSAKYVLYSKEQWETWRQRQFFQKDGEQRGKQSRKQRLSQEHQLLAESKLLPLINWVLDLFWRKTSPRGGCFLGRSSFWQDWRRFYSMTWRLPWDQLSKNLSLNSNLTLWIQQKRSECCWRCMRLLSTGLPDVSNIFL